jgi:hypothetical protein
MIPSASGHAEKAAKYDQIDSGLSTIEYKTAPAKGYMLNDTDNSP